MATTLLIEVIERGEPVTSCCPCGCGHTGTDRPVTRVQLVEMFVYGATRQYIRTAQSVDGGGVFFNQREFPAGATYAASYRALLGMDD